MAELPRGSAEGQSPDRAPEDDDISALRHDRIAAPFRFDRPVNGEAVLAYVETFLVPTLKPDDDEVMDNLSSHRGRRTVRAIRQVGAKLLFMRPSTPRT